MASLFPEEALGHEPARREHLYAFWIVQGEGLALVVDMCSCAASRRLRASFRLSACLSIFLDISASAPLSSHADARVHHGVQNVRQEVRQQRQDGDKGEVEHREGYVAVYHGVI